MFIEKLHHTNMKELKKGIWTTFHNTAFYTEIYVKAFKKSSVIFNQILSWLQLMVIKTGIIYIHLLK